MIQEFRYRAFFQFFHHPFIELDGKFSDWSSKRSSDIFFLFVYLLILVTKMDYGLLFPLCKYYVDIANIELWPY